MRARLRPRFSGFRRRYYSQAEKKRIRRRLRLMAFVGVLCILAALVNARIAPLLHMYAANAARSAMTEAINTAVAKVIDSSEIRYSDLIQIQTDSSDNIIAIESDILKINRLKAEVTNAVLEELKSARYHQVSVPLGDLLGGNLLLGRGPRIPVRISVAGSVETGMESQFTSAGINQTNHQISMTVQLELFSAVPGSDETVDVESQFLIAETVLVGKVPESFTNVTGDDRETIGKIFDYADTQQ